jgi:luciferase family oxidoreductase group 1
MKLGILDQAPIAAGKTAAQALEESVRLAQLGDRLGYTRYWIAEHHDLPGLACPAPEVMLGRIGAATSRIRLGSGAVLLPHYRPYKIAEVFHLLAVLFPGRVDIGIGRAPGGPAEAAIALAGHFLEQVRKMPEAVDELLHFFRRDFPKDHPFAKLSAAPLPDVPPEPWILGTSAKSAVMAAEKGLAYAFGHFMSGDDVDGPEVVQLYRSRFQPNDWLREPKTIVAVSVFCAETTELAEKGSMSSLLWGIQTAKGESSGGIPSAEAALQYRLSDTDTRQLQRSREKMIIGNPHEVRQRLRELQLLYRADELMLVTIAHSGEDRLNSYRLIAEECGL